MVVFVGHEDIARSIDRESEDVIEVGRRSQAVDLVPDQGLAGDGRYLAGRQLADCVGVFGDEDLSASPQCHAGRFAEACVRRVAVDIAFAESGGGRDVAIRRYPA